MSFRSLPRSEVALLRELCRENNVTMSMAVATAALLAASDVAHDDLDFSYEAYRLLLGAVERSWHGTWR